MAQSPIVVVATDKLEHSITIAMRDDVRIEYFVGSRFDWLVEKLKSWIREEWFNYAVSQLTKAASEIKLHKPESEPQLRVPPWTRADYGRLEERALYHGSVTGRISSNPTKEWLSHRALGRSIEDISKIIYGHPNWPTGPFAFQEFQPEEIDMASRVNNQGDGDYKNLPDATYRFTVIAVEAQTFHYHQKRRWYKSEDAAKGNLAKVLENADVQLAIVECKDVYERKPKVEIKSVFKKSRR